MGMASAPRAGDLKTQGSLLPWQAPVLLWASVSLVIVQGRLLWSLLPLNPFLVLGMPDPRGQGGGAGEVRVGASPRP